MKNNQERLLNIIKYQIMRLREIGKFKLQYKEDLEIRRSDAKKILSLDQTKLDINNKLYLDLGNIHLYIEISDTRKRGTAEIPLGLLHIGQGEFSLSGRT